MSYRRENGYSRVTCWKCEKVGHAARHCRRITPKEELYEVDRVETGIKFKLFKHTEVHVTTPGTRCGRCREKLKENKELKHGDCSCADPVPKIQPIDDFKDLKITGEFLDNIRDESCCNFEAPTPIQRYALPIISKGYDVMGCAQTGTGKTAAYIIPMVQFIREKGLRKVTVGMNTPQKPEVLILAPTRELCMQIEKMIRKLTNQIRPECGIVEVHAGREANKPKQLGQIREGCNILISTTGRLLQLIHQHMITLENIEFFVLDEADKMIDMGFKPDIDLIIDSKKTGIPSTASRTSLLFSATFRFELQEIARKSLKKNHRLIEAGAINSAQPNVKQNFEYAENYDQKLTRLKEILMDLLVTEKEKFLECTCWNNEEVLEDDMFHPNIKDYLLHMLGTCSQQKILIFVNTKVAAEEMTEVISDYIRSQFIGRFKRDLKDLWIKGGMESEPATLENYGATYINGNLGQTKRTRNLEDFKDGVYPIMFTTNVTARGIDIEKVTYVINFDLPVGMGIQGKPVKGKTPLLDQFEEYIHRIGRTGRAGNQGVAISFFENKTDDHLAIPLLRMLTKAEQTIPDWLEDKAKESTIEVTKGPQVKHDSWDEKKVPGPAELWPNEQ